MDAVDAFRTHYKKVTATLRGRGYTPEEAADAVQEAFVRLLKECAKGTEVRDPLAFLMRAAFNAAVDQRRREHKDRREHTRVEELTLTDPAESVEGQAAGQQSIQKTAALLDRAIGERDRGIFFLHCFAELTYEEIAEQLGVTIYRVRKAIEKAMSVLSMQHPRPDPSGSEDP